MFLTNYLESFQAETMNVQTLMIVCVRTKQRNILIVYSKFRD